MTGFGFSHQPLVNMFGSGVTSFFRKIEVYGSENVPDEGPIIFACTHTNMAIDPAVLSYTVPHGYSLHYWVKDSLFRNPVMAAVMKNAGNIPVDRKTKNNQKLFKGTFEALAAGECIGLFPEGTSHTNAHLIPLKDGLAWSALEYLIYLKGGDGQEPHAGKPVTVVPVGIAYCDKSKYRSRLVITYCPPITTDRYAKEFLSGSDSAKKSAVKRLTRDIELELYKTTVNGPDWETNYAADMARELLWKYDRDLALADYVDVQQTLVDLLSTDDARIEKLKQLLYTYHQLLVASRLSNGALTDLPLQRDLDPNNAVPLPGRIRTLAILVKDTFISLIQFPLFVVPFLFNIPLYSIGMLGANMAENELETQAQMKVFLGIFVSFLLYPIYFFIFLWMFRTVPLGGLFAAGVVWLLSKYHAALIDRNYAGLKKLVAAWRVLIGVWCGSRVEMNLNSFVDHAAAFAPNPPQVAGLPKDKLPEKYVRPKKLPSRVLVRHVLRMRVQAARALTDTLLELEAADANVGASFWLAERYGGDVLPVARARADMDADVPAYERPWPQGRRGAREVVAFLRGRGARLGATMGGESEYWANASASASASRGQDTPGLEAPGGFKMD